MKISVVTASYNYEAYIKETIESVIAQTYTDWEMIIVDDGSKDSSVDVIKSYCNMDSRIKLFQHDGGVNKGLVETVKLGVEKATGEWIVFLESDDTITPDYIETKLKIIETNPEVKFIFNDVNMFGDEECIQFREEHFKKVKSILLNKKYPRNLLRFFYELNVVATFSVVMLKKDLLKDIDYNVEFKPLLDWYLWSQIAINNDFYYLDKKLTNWRMHKNSYISVRPTFEERNKWNMQLKNNWNKDKNLFPKFLNYFLYYKKNFLRIYFRRAEVCFLGNWYSFGKGKNEKETVSITIDR